MLSDVITWWAQQMLGLVPPCLKPANRWDEVLLIDVPPGDAAPESGDFRLILRRRRQDRLLGHFSFDAHGIAAARRARGRLRKIVLILPSATLMEHIFALPLAAEADLAQVLRYEIDRLTPFSAEEVFWTWAIERRDRARGQLHIRLSLLLQTAARPVLDRLEEVGLPPSAVEATNPGGHPRLFVLGSAMHDVERVRRTVLRWGFAACAALGLAIIVTPFVTQQRAISQTERRIAVLQPRVSEAFALRRRLEGQAAGADIIAAEVARDGNALAVLAEMTGILPDNTFLTEFGLSQKAVSISGQSGDAAGLIAAMSSDPMLRSPGFSAPVTTAPNGSGNLFAIRATVGP
jgi:general secretion pathway protein L